MCKAEIVLDFESKDELLTGLFNVQMKLYANDLGSKDMIIGKNFVVRFRGV